MVWALVWFAVAGLAEGFQWMLQFRVAEGKGPYWLVMSKFWNPQYSWANKWDNPWMDNPKERFWLSSRQLVWLTDGFHLAQFVRTMSLTVGLCGLVTVWQALMLMLIFKIFFTVSYNSVRN
jgi:hypothetical protein